MTIRDFLKKIVNHFPLLKKTVILIRQFPILQVSGKDIKKGSKEYKDHLKEEIKHYEEIFSEGRLFQDVPPIWQEVETRFSELIKKGTGQESFYHYVANCAKGKKSVTIYSIGSGACGVELIGIAPLLKKMKVKFKFICTDINKTILAQAKKEAIKKNIDFETRIVDANTLKLEKNKYDIVIAYAALHHFIELDHIAEEINKSLKNDGHFVTVDIPTRNGYLMWDETYEKVKALWKILPAKFKISHTAYAKPTYMENYPNIDYSKSSFECVNSEAVLPAIRKHMTEIAYVPGMAFCRRFFDTQYGPNFDLRKKFDKSIFNFIMNLDNYYIESKILKPETFFGAYKKKQI